MAIVRERERMGRDLHDGIIQSLYGGDALTRGCSEGTAPSR
jgi:signal transduction histidine kinase